jgi:glycosyltransferase involved in cell wall biosynthesis
VPTIDAGSPLSSRPSHYFGWKTSIMTPEVQPTDLTARLPIYYLHPVEFHFHSGMTLQVVRDLTSVSRVGFRALAVGTYRDEPAFEEVRRYIGGSPVRLLATRGHRYWSEILLWRALLTCRLDQALSKVVIVRSDRLARRALRWRCAARHPMVVMELHERAFPHLLANTPGECARLKAAYQRLFLGVDGVILTNYSQEPLFLEEFQQVPPYAVLPNGVEWDFFHRASHNLDDLTSPRVVTMMTKFTEWKDIESVFDAVGRLPANYRLRIAGGKSRRNDAELVERLTAKFGLAGRVEFLGFVSPSRLVDEVLSGSSVLLVPLGDNVISRHLTSPMKLFEYMATRIPVVARDFPSIRLVAGGDTVHLYDGGAAALAAAIEGATCDPERERRIDRMNALARRFSYEERSRRFKSFVELLLQRRPEVAIRHSRFCAQRAQGTKPTGPRDRKETDS